VSVFIHSSTGLPILSRYGTLGYTGFWEALAIEYVFYLLGGMVIALIAPSHKVIWTFLTGLIVPLISYFSVLISWMFFDTYILTTVYCLIVVFIGLGLGTAIFKKR
jgi:hypothetical protein